MRREVIESDEGARKGVMKEGATTEGAITRGTHLTAVYPGLVFQRTTGFRGYQVTYRKRRRTRRRRIVSKKFHEIDE